MCDDHTPPGHDASLSSLFVSFREGLITLKSSTLPQRGQMEEEEGRHPVQGYLCPGYPLNSHGCGLAGLSGQIFWASFDVL